MVVRAGAIAGLVLAVAPLSLYAQSQAVADVQLTPHEVALSVGDRRPLFAAAYDAQGKILSAAVIQYLSSDTTIVTVTQDGTVTGRAAGSAQVQAVAGGRRDSASVTVAGVAPATPPAPEPAGPTITAIVLTPAALQLLPLEPARLIAHVTTPDSTTPAVLPRLTWRSGDSHIAAVDRDGVVVGIAPGVTTITVSAAGGVSGTVAVQVDTAVFTTLEQKAFSPGGTDTLYATVPSQGGRHLTAGLTWSSLDTSVVQMAPGGVVHAREPGQTDILVRGYGMTGRIHALVHQPIVTFNIAPRASEGVIEVPITTARHFEAQGLDAGGNVVADAPITYEVGDTAVVQFSASTGTLTARKIGQTTLTARLTGFQPAVWTVRVVPVKVALDRHRIAVGVGDRIQLAARLVDSSGAIVPGVSGPVTWTSARSDVASVSAGAISASSLGYTRVRASTPWGTADTVDVYVTGDFLLSSDRAARGGVGIYQVRFADPAAFAPVLTDTSTNLDAQWSPDRTRIAFASNRGGTFDLWIMNADGTGLTRVTSAPGDETEPVWTPDGKRLVYTAATNGQTQIASIGTDGSDPVTLTAAAGGNRQPAVSPDGRIIAFSSARGGNYDIYQMGIDGSDPRRITNTKERDQSPHFFANGDLLYATDRPRGGTYIVKQSGVSRTVLAETDDAVVALSLSSDGRRYLYLAGRQADKGPKVEYRLVTQRTGNPPEPVIVPLGPGEQVATPSF